MKSSRTSFLIAFSIGLVLILSACSGQTEASQVQGEISAQAQALNVVTTPIASSETPVEDTDQEAVDSPKSWGLQPTQTDDQGAVVVEITPLNLRDAEQTLDFEVSLNTHSVDLSMDLTKLASLQTNNGYYVQAVLWDAPSGGHHVSGTLSFPSQVDGVSVIENASKISIVIENVDAPARVFSWER